MENDDNIKQNDEEVVRKEQEDQEKQEKQETQDKLNKLTSQENKQNTEENINKMDIDDIVLNTTNFANNYIKTPNEIKTELTQNMLEWKNEANQKKIKKEQTFNCDYEKISNIIVGIEEKISEYLRQNDKEWDFSDIRANFVYNN